MHHTISCVGVLLQRCPRVAEVLAWHGVDVDDVAPTLSLGALCWLHSIEPQRLVRDLLAVQPDGAHELWLPLLELPLSLEPVSGLDAS